MWSGRVPRPRRPRRAQRPRSAPTTRVSSLTWFPPGRVISGRSRNKARPVHGSAQWRRKTARATYAWRVLTARRLSKRYGEKRVLRGIDLTLPRGGFFVVTGPNGSGKTTLLRSCAGLAQPTEGTIERGVTRGQVGSLGP